MRTRLWVCLTAAGQPTASKASQDISSGGVANRSPSETCHPVHMPTNLPICPTAIVRIHAQVVFWLDRSQRVALAEIMVAVVSAYFSHFDERDKIAAGLLMTAGGATVIKSRQEAGDPRLVSRWIEASRLRITLAGGVRLFQQGNCH